MPVTATKSRILKDTSTNEICFHRHCITVSCHSKSRFKLYREGRKAGPGLAAFAESGDLDLLRETVGKDGFIVEVGN